MRSPAVTMQNERALVPQAAAQAQAQAAAQAQAETFFRGLVPQAQEQAQASHKQQLSLIAQRLQQKPCIGHKWCHQSPVQCLPHCIYI